MNSNEINRRNTEIDIDSKGKIEGMAVSVTLVFACESHRQAWLEGTGRLDDDAARRDYERRRDNTNLMFSIGPIRPEQSRVVKKVDSFIVGDSTSAPSGHGGDFTVDEKLG